MSVFVSHNVVMSIGACIMRHIMSEGPYMVRGLRGNLYNEIYS